MKKISIVVLFFISTNIANADVLNDFKIYDINAKYDLTHPINTNNVIKKYHDSFLSDSEKIIFSRMEENYLNSYDHFIDIKNNTGFIDWNSDYFKLNNIYLYSFFTYHYNKTLKNYAGMNILAKEKYPILFNKNNLTINETLKKMNSWDEKKLTAQELFIKSITKIENNIINAISNNESNDNIKKIINDGYLETRKLFYDYTVSLEKGYEIQYRNFNKMYPSDSEEKYNYLINLNRINLE